MQEPDFISEFKELKKQVADLQRASQLPNSSGLLRLLYQGTADVVFTGTEAVATANITHASIGLSSPMAAAPVAHIVQAFGAAYDSCRITPQIISTFPITVGADTVLAIDKKTTAYSTKYSTTIEVLRSDRIRVIAGAETYKFRYFLYEEAGAL